MTARAEPPGVAPRTATAVTNESKLPPHSPAKPSTQPQHLVTATRVSRQASTGWPALVPVSDADARRAGSAAAAREIAFVRNGLATADPEALARAVKVRIKVGDPVASVLPLPLAPGGAR